MLRTVLRQTHDSYDVDRWGDYDALYSGGKKFFERLGRFMHANPTEPPGVYANRKREAHYRCYMGGIVDYFASYLFTSPLVVRAKNEKKEAVEPDDFYSEFKEDCDGLDNDIHVFLRGRVTEALVKQRSWWLVEMPEAPADAGADTYSKKEWEDLGLNRGKVRSLDAEQVLDWEVDDDGQLEWAIVLSVKTVRPRPQDTRKLVIERYDVYDRETVERFELQYEKTKRPRKDVEVPSVSKRPHGFDRVPLVNIDVDEALWLANRVASPQIEHFRLSNAQTWSIRRTCYAMPVFMVESDTKPPVMGAGYYIMIGKDEKMEWGAPPSSPFAAIAEEVKSQKDEIFRVVHQMAMGVDNNAAAVGRSGKSKEVDAAAIRVVLSALGTLVRESLERTYALISQARGEDYDWAIEGLDSFEQPDLDEFVAAVTGLLALDIKSPTFHREIQKRAVMLAVPDAEQSVKDTMAKEIEENVTDESVLNPPTLGDEPDGDEGGGEAGSKPGAAEPPAVKPVKAPAAPKATARAGAAA